MTLDKFSAKLNSQLESGKQVRIVNTYRHSNLTGRTTTQIHANGRRVATIRNVIIYPGAINCTKSGTTMRITGLSNRGGFGAEHMKGAWSYSLEVENNDVDYGEDSCGYYGSDEYFEDGKEAQLYE